MKHISSRAKRLPARAECPSCGKKDFRYLRKSDSWYCRLCGTEWGRDWVEEPKNARGKGKGK